MQVSDIKITDLTPVIKNPALAKLVPKTLLSKHISFTISGVNNAISNALRRTIACELLVNGLHAEYEHVKTNDMFVIPEMILGRLKMVPIDQTCPLDAVFELDVTNKTAGELDVKMGDMRIVNPGHGKKPLRELPFNHTTTIVTLKPGKSMKISNIGLHQDYCYHLGYGAYVVACNVASVAVDQQPINLYEGGGIPSSISNPQVWKISFNTNGTLPPREIITVACDNIIARVTAIKELLFSIENNNDEYILTINGESDTIGNLFMRTINDIYPDIRAVVYSTSSVGRVLTLRIRCDEDINTIYDTTIKHIVKVFNTIRKFFD